MDNEKYEILKRKTEDVEFVPDPITEDDVIEESKVTIEDMIKNAVTEALKEDIKANTILINEKFVKVPSHWANIMGHAVRLPSMVCGLECYFTDEFPDKYSFAVLEAPETQREKLVKQTVVDILLYILKEKGEVYGRDIVNKLAEKYGVEVGQCE